MEKINVFVDFHHASLLQSFILLFEKRLGGKVYRPIGMEWHSMGYWNVYDHPFTREQFLSTTLGIVEPPPQMYPDGTRPLNIVDKVEDGVYYCQDIDSGYYNKAITYNKFMSMDFDYVIASIPQHIEPYKKLCREHPARPKMIFQIGNAWQQDAIRADNIMASAIVQLPPETNAIIYHQEFDTTIFKPDETVLPGNTIYSFVNCFGIERFYESDFQLFNHVERIMNNWSFKAYGGQCRDGAAHGSQKLADKMRQSKFIWHTKFGGDGYGHIIHNAAAVGTPLVVKKEYYRGKLADALLEDGVTCVTIDGLSPAEVANKIEAYSEPDKYQKLCENTYARFKQVVDFDREEQELRQFLTRLK